QTKRLPRKMIIRPRQIAVPFALAHQAILDSNLTCHGEKQADGVSRHRVADRFRRIGDNYAEFCSFRDRNVVRSAAGANDHAAALQDVEILGVDTLMTAKYPDDIGIATDFGQFFARPALLEHE